MKAHFRSVSPARQRGNTLTGIIIGLIIGLVIAVIVALMITKGATPFTDKTGKLGKMSEPQAGQAADPNKPLYGDKQAAREANRQFAGKPRAPEADPLGDVIAGLEKDAAPAAPAAPAPAPAPVAAADAGEETIIYYLQAGAFRELADAENTRAKLALLGFEAAITDRANGVDVLHRVRIGPFNQVETMNRARAKLIDAGVDVAIVRNQK